jgi:hypothetical protein
MTEPTNGEILEHVEGLRRELKIEWDAHKESHTQHELAHAREHRESEKAIENAAKLVEQNKKDSNEWRGAMDDREKTLATKVDVGTLTKSIDDLRTAEIRRVEQERQRTADMAEDKADALAARNRDQWRVGLIVGVLATGGSILINLVIRLLSGQ